MGVFAASNLEIWCQAPLGFRQDILYQISIWYLIIKAVSAYAVIPNIDGGKDRACVKHAKEFFDEKKYTFCSGDVGGGAGIRVRNRLRHNRPR
jgi:hypothetical protein